MHLKSYSDLDKIVSAEVELSQKGRNSQKEMGTQIIIKIMYA